MQVMHFLWRGILAIVTMGALALTAVYARTEYQIRRHVAVPRLTDFHVPRDSATLARGSHYVHAVNGCAGCHDGDLGGKVILDDAKVMRLVSSNLTTGRGGVLSQYDDAALATAIRHGVAPDGRVLRFMPSHEFSGMADDHVAAIIAYIRSQPPVDHELPPITVGPIARVLSVAGKMALFPYYRIDHNVRPLAQAPAGATEEHGRYLARSCIGCHGEGMSGGRIPGAPGSWPAAANLTPTGLGTWTEESFIRTMRTGVDPSGQQLREPMPWQSFGKMSDDELRALWMYLATLSRKPSGGR